MCEGTNPPPYFLTSQRTTLPLQMSPATPTIPPTPPRTTPSRWREPQALAPQPKDRRPSTATPSWWKLETVSQDGQIWTVACVFQGEILWLCRIFFGGMHHIFCLSGCEEHPDHMMITMREEELKARMFCYFHVRLLLCFLLLFCFNVFIFLAKVKPKKFIGNNFLQVFLFFSSQAGV